jgi:hypothetical protein
VELTPAAQLHAREARKQRLNATGWSPATAAHPTNTASRNAGNISPVSIPTGKAVFTVWIT